MMIRRTILLAALLLVALGAAAAQSIWLPTDWHLTAPEGFMAITGTMPQGLALSPDGTKLAVVESGVNPAALRVLDARDLHVLQTVALEDAFGTPVWQDERTVLVPGASTNAVLAVDLRTGGVTPRAAGEYVSSVALADDGTIDATDDLSGMLTQAGTRRGTWHTGAHPAAIAIDGRNTYVADRGASTVTVLPSGESIAVDLHPAALALSNDGTRLYVACSDADSVDVVDTRTNRVSARIGVGLPQGRGASPNALAVARDGTVYVSLGAQDAIAEVRDDRVVARAPAGWYPTGVAVDAKSVYVSDGRGEGSRANAGFNPERRNDPEYVASAMVGSIREISRDAFDRQSTAEVLSDVPAPIPTPAQTVVRANGPIRHVIYIIKENRTYDEVLGDVPGADGDPKLVWFGKEVTPNEHALAERFGIYDRTFTDAQVSADGHNWSTAAFANDYLERFWPPLYAGRRKQYDFEDGATASMPGTGYLWDDADAHHVSLRDYGEFVTDPANKGGEYTTHMAGLIGKIDPQAAGFDLTVSDEARVDAWQREFDRYVRDGDLPQLEIVRLPNDHTSGTKPGWLTPQAYVAQNDHALGRLVDTVSHSRYWAHTAIFAIEDDAQNGPDHVDDQRTTLYVISPYAVAGVHHAHYTTSSVLRTIELLLGLPPMTIYDAVAPPIYDGFALRANLRPYGLLAPQIDVTAKNRRTAYGAALSERMDFAHADDADPRALNDILAHVAGSRVRP
jgi:YVTN family beta-propeller protein